MRKLFFIFALLPFITNAQSEKLMEKTYTYLALGDSYTLGESVLLHQNFPYQTVQLLRHDQFKFSAPEIIAKTGWTTDELEDAMKNHQFLPKYDFVTLLIGVNNQYQGRDVIEYKEHFEHILNQAINLVNKKEHVIIVSIPDYGATPFAASMEREKISKEIDVFNNVAKALSVQYNVHYVEITEASRDATNDTSLLASDTLHPSEKEYEKWAKKISKLIISQLK